MGTYAWKWTNEKLITPNLNKALNKSLTQEFLHKCSSFYRFTSWIQERRQVDISDAVETDLFVILKETINTGQIFYPEFGYAHTRNRIQSSEFESLTQIISVIVIWFVQIWTHEFVIFNKSLGDLSLCDFSFVDCVISWTPIHGQTLSCLEPVLFFSVFEPEWFEPSVIWNSCPVIWTSAVRDPLTPRNSLQ